MNTERIKRLQKTINSPLLVCKRENLFYLLGVYFFDPAFLLVTKKTVVLFEGTLEVVQGVKTDRLSNIGKYVLPGSDLDVEGDLNLFQQRYVKKRAPRIKLNIAEQYIEQMRLIKNAEEIQALQKVADITHQVFKQVKKVLRQKQFSEQQLAHYIKFTGIKLGADKESFAAIVGAGENSAIPHHRPTPRKIKTGEPIVLDFGFKLNNYCSDFTRTVFLKKASSNIAAVYNAVADSYTKALAAARAGMTGGELDAVARNFLKQSKYDKYFIHSLGHGTGLLVHEAPNITINASGVLENGMVFSIEPGVYIKNSGGVRIEDLVYLKNGQAKLFFKASTKLEDNIIK